MVKVRVRKTGKKTEALIKSLEQLDDSTVQVGHFASQGTHSDSGLTYPELMALWHVGRVGGHEGVKRSPLMNFNFTELVSKKLSNSPEFIAAMQRWSSGVLRASSDDELLEAIGKLTAEQYQAVFGVTGPYMPPDSTDTPMLETGELKSAVAYRTSKNNQIKEV